MKRVRQILAAAIAIMFFAYSAQAEKYHGQVHGQNNTAKSLSAGCASPASSSELDLNNVRALIHTGGDMWWDLQGKPKYEVPKGSGKTALFAGSIWVGGKDVNGQLKLCAIKFRQTGYDYWPGPLIEDGPDRATVSPEVCARYDQHFKITRSEVSLFRTWFADPASVPGYSPPSSILNWPGNVEFPGYSKILAPFFDKNEDDVYDPSSGDYPLYDLDGSMPCGTTQESQIPRLYGDLTLWWVYNDKGNIHTETSGDAIGMEIKAQAFAFATNDELNDMTFYNYQLINRSTYTLTETYFGVWTDADLGAAKDDWVGCDVKRGLGFLYNGDAIDDGEIWAYGGPTPPPPAIGVDFFEGPYMDKDNLDNPEGGCDASINGLNFGDGIPDNERWGMRRFIYFNNDQGVQGDPTTASAYYNYLIGKWATGVPMVHGGQGIASSSGATTVETNFMFPGTSDPCNWGTNGIQTGIPNWTESTSNNSAGDRRFVQSAGPFTLYPGASNYITTGVVFARAVAGGPYASVLEVKNADDKAQALFENCFKIVDGPDAPDLDIVELDNQLIFHISNTKGASNNYRLMSEDYLEKDPFILCPDTSGDGIADSCDQNYVFEGYQVFQLISDEASISDIHDINKARLVFQCDVKNNVSQLVNFYFDDALNANIPVEEVNGSNSGIVHSFKLTDDAFAVGDRKLINNKKYYYLAIAYGFNQFEKYDQNSPLALKGQKTPYKPSRKGSGLKSPQALSASGNAIKIYEVTPHINKPENAGTILNSTYGQGPAITQIEGGGNWGNVLELSDESIAKILVNYIDSTPIYKPGYGPIRVKVIDPLNVPSENFTLKFDSITKIHTNSGSTQSFGSGYISPYYKNGATSSGKIKWYVCKTNELSDSSKYIWCDNLVSLEGEEKLITKWGLSIEIGQCGFPIYEYSFLNGFAKPYSNQGLLESTMEFSNINKQWLSFVYDTDLEDYTNWIRSGTKVPDVKTKWDDWSDMTDSTGVFEKVIGGGIAPYYLCSKIENGPLHESSRGLMNSNYVRLSSVDIVFTSDKSKWTRCPVLEMCENDTTSTGSPVEPVRSEGLAYKFDLRDHLSVDKDGNTGTSEATLDGAQPKGMGWFPGYAIDVETGERLNMMFGEDSWLGAENGKDMKWNPTSTLYSDLYNQTGGFSGDVLFGGKHYIYIVGHTAGLIEMPYYDKGQRIYNLLKTGPNSSNIKNVMANVMWTGIPLLASGFKVGDCDVKIRIRIANPYIAGVGAFKHPNPINNNWPMYTFNTSNIATSKNDNATAKDALKLINIVPNPYYGYSDYEQSPFDNYVKITNLPQKCTISIYNVAGTLIRRFKKDSPQTFQDWDLKNNANITIASGVYIIHIDAPGIGEKILKWFGALRPIDLNKY